MSLVGDFVPVSGAESDAESVAILGMGSTVNV